MSEMELLARFEGQDPIGFVRLDSNDHRQLNEPDYYRNRSSSREVHVEPHYNRSNNNEYVSDERPVDEEEVTFEEETRDRDRRTNHNAQRRQSEREETNFDFSVADHSASMNHAEVDEGASDGLSTDELEFIKSTVTSATKRVSADDIFKSAEPDQPAWTNGNGHANPSPGRGNMTPRQTEARPVQPENPFTPRSQPTGRPANNDTGAGWIVKPSVTQRNENPHPPPPTSRPVRPSGFSSPLFGAESDADDLSATPEEIEKIRRILNDLD
jgi:hypothetical protein